MSAPAVKGYMPLCVTPRSRVCDEQGVGQWPMWKRYDRIQGIVNQYVDEPYRNFLSLPYHEIDKLKAEELFYWYTPRCDTQYTRMSRTGDDHDYYMGIFEETLTHYQSIVAKLKSIGKAEEANFLDLSLKYVGESDENVYCGDGRVIATVWGMRPRNGENNGGAILFTELVPEVEIHTVRYELGSMGSTTNPTVLKKSHGTKIYAHQVPSVVVKEGFEWIGWDHNPVNAVVSNNLLFTALYRELPKEKTLDDVPPEADTTEENNTKTEKQTNDEPTQKCHIRFLTPDNLIIKDLDVEYGKRILPGNVPQLPLVEGVSCPSWDGDPFNDIIDADRDYKAVSPQKPEKQTHSVRFLTPDGKVISQAQVEHGSSLSSSLIPPLPVVKGKVCSAWNNNPLGEIINSDRDFVAIPPQTVVEVKKEEQTLHVVRFLNPDSSELMRNFVPHGGHLQPDQIPQLPTIDGRNSGKWIPDPTKQVINRDTDFIVRSRRIWHWPWKRVHGTRRGFWQWLLYVILFLLLVFLVLYIMYRCNPCSK